MSEICVFLGPTLAVADARAELDAVYLPPVSAGDVCRLWRRRPRVIGIVDGCFERVPAVWHKEIMWIMERGVHVFGSASMGALRAAELESFGMRGVGRVYQAFRDGTLDRDDEVAVAHGADRDGYPRLSEAMVNIRGTLQAAYHEGIISDTTRDVLMVTGTALFYHDRNWPGLLEAGAASGADPTELSALRRWLPAGRIDQQAVDAVAMLREMRGFIATGPAPQQVPWTMANTTRWEAAKRYAGSMPTEGAAGSALTLDSVLDEIRLLGPDAFEAARSRSLLRLFAADLAEREGMMVDGRRLQDAVAEFRMRSSLERGAEFAEFLAASDLSAGDFERLVIVDEKVRWACGRAEWDALSDLANDLGMRGDYGRLVTRAREKLDQLRRSGGQETAPAEADRYEQKAVRWYFADRLGTTVPEDLADYAQSSGFGDELAFRRAVRHEYQYVCGQ
jgi:AraC-like DNA-binding protein